jgi:large subunit ribosomal protein L23
MIQIVKKPILSEKAMRHTPDGCYVFQVDISANKIDIKKAVEQMFEVKVKSVRTLIVKPKYSVKYTKKGIMKGKTTNIKKAYITLQAGYNIELVGVEASATASS